MGHSRSAIRTAISWSLFLLASTGLRAADSPLVRLEESSHGNLAMRASPAAAWHLVSLGAEIGDGDLRTSTAGPCRLTVPGGVLHIGPDTRISLQSSRRTLTLSEGQLYLDSAEAWTVVAGQKKLAVPAKGVVELQVSPDGKVSLRQPAKTPAIQAIEGSTSDHSKSAPQEIITIQHSPKWIATELPRQGLGELTVPDPQRAGRVPLDVARYHMNIVLQPPVALVQIDQSFYNRFSTQQEGTFEFQLPPGASVSRFAMYTTPTTLIEGELIEQAQAAQIYESIVNVRRDPALLEQLAGNEFRMRVFPIPPQDTKRILLDYTLPLVERSAGTYEFSLPMMSGGQPVWDFRVTGTIRGGASADSVSIVSNSKFEVSRKDPQAIRFETRATEHKPDSQLYVRFQRRIAEDVTVRSQTVVPGDVAAALLKKTAADEKVTLDPIHYFQVSIRPETLFDQPETTGAQTHKNLPAADVLVVADTSGDFRQRARQRHVVRTILRNLRDIDRFQLGCIDLAYRPLLPAWSSPTSINVQQAVASLDKQVLLGKTDYSQSLTQSIAAFGAAPIQKDAPRRRILIYVGDGVAPKLHAPLSPIEKSLAADLVRQSIHFHAALLDEETAGRKFLSQLADSSRGRVFDLSRDISLERLFAWTLEGCPSNEPPVTVEMDGVASDDLFVATDRLSGSALQVFGRRNGAGEIPLRVRWSHAGQIVSRNIPVRLPPQVDDHFVGRLWGQHKLDQLQSRFSALPEGPPRNELHTRIVAVSQEWTLLSRSTSFLVLETEADYAKYKIERKLRHKYWKPEHALPANPPMEALVRAARRAEEARQRTSKAVDIQQEFKFIGETLQAGLPFAALTRLHDLLRSPAFVPSEEFRKLEREALQTLRHNEVIRALDTGRWLFERGEPPAFGADPLERLRYSLRRPDQAIVAAQRELIPAVLLRPVTPPKSTLNLEELASWLRTATKMNVVIDQASLSEKSIAVDVPTMNVAGIRSMSVHSLLRHLLPPHKLYYEIDGNNLTITTATKSKDRLEDRIFPVGDLYLNSQHPSPGLLANSRLDLEIAATSRIREKLSRPLTMKLEKTTLLQALNRLSERLDENIVIDEGALAEESLPLDTEIRANLRNVPAKDILKQISGTHYGTEVRDEAIVFTSRTSLKDRLEIRPYSTIGLAFRRDASLRALVRRNSTSWWMDPQEINPFSSDGTGRKGTGTGWGWNGMIGGFGGGFGGGGMGIGGGGVSAPMGAGVQTSLPTGAAAGHVVEVLAGDVEKQDAVKVEPEPEEVVRVPLEKTGDTPRAPTPPAGAINGGQGAPQRLIDLLREELGSSDPAEAKPGAAPPVTIEQIPVISRNILHGFRTNVADLDADALIELLQECIAPESWTDNGGSGSMRFLHLTLGLAVRQTPIIHELIEELLSKLQQLPIVPSETSGLFPSRFSERGAARFSVEEIMDFLKESIAPENWDESGGPGAIRLIESRAALQIRTTAAVHEQVEEMLVTLRRAAFLSRRGVPWKYSDLRDGWKLRQMSGLTNLSGLAGTSELPPPQPEELEILRSRTEPFRGTQEWRRIPVKGPASVLKVRNDSHRIELELADRVARADQVEAVVAFPGLAVAERGRAAERLRTVVDVQLPWLPHRSNRELARIFQVVLMRDDAKSFQLKFGVPATGDGAALLVTFDRSHGLPITWESWMNGELTMRLRFEDLAESGGQRYWRKVTAEDRAGKVLERWELQSAKVDSTPLPDVAKWPGYVISNPDSPGESEKSPGVTGLLTLLEQRDWKGADAALNTLLHAQPDQPFLLYLHAWSLSQQEEVPVERVAAELRKLAQSGRSALLGLVNDGGFERLTPQMRFEALRECPAAKHTPEVLRHLAEAAFAAIQPQAALEFLEQAAAQLEKVGAELPLRSEKLRIAALIDLGQADKGIALAFSRGERPGLSPEDMAEYSNVLFQHGRTVEAERLWKIALANPVVTPERRFEILLSRADVQKGLPRWRTIQQAAEDATTPPTLREFGIRRLLHELIQPAHAELAGQLAEAAKDPGFKAMLLLRQSDLYHELKNEKAAADVAWKVHLSGRLPVDGIDWLSLQLQLARQHDRQIELLEGRLHKGTPLSASQFGHLLEAYEAVGRAADAARVRTNAEDLRANSRTVPNIRDTNPYARFGAGMGGMGMGGMGMF